MAGAVRNHVDSGGGGTAGPDFGSQQQQQVPASFFLAKALATVLCSCTWAETRRPCQTVDADQAAR